MVEALVIIYFKSLKMFEIIRHGRQSLFRVKEIEASAHLQFVLVRLRPSKQRFLNQQEVNTFDASTILSLRFMESII